MRFFPIAFTTNLAGFPGATFSRLSGSFVIWGTEYNREEEEREIEREGERESNKLT